MPIRFANKGINFLGPDDETEIQIIGRQQVFRQLQGKNADGAIPDNGVRSAVDPKDCRKMTGRRVEDSLGKQQRTGRLCSGRHDLGIKAPRVNDAAIRNGKNQRNAIERWGRLDPSQGSQSGRGGKSRNRTRPAQPRMRREWCISWDSTNQIARAVLFVLKDFDRRGFARE